MKTTKEELMKENTKLSLELRQATQEYSDMRKSLSIIMGKCSRRASWGSSQEVLSWMEIAAEIGKLKSHSEALENIFYSRTIPF